jgi:hypothetical protein
MSYYEPKEEHLTILKDDKLFKRITEEELDKRIVHEFASRKAIFLSMCSIWVNDCQSHVFINSKSSTGKSYIAKACFDLFPVWLKEYKTKLSPEALTYWHDAEKEPAWSWDHKLLYLEDCRHSLLKSEAFKVMLSEGSDMVIVNKGNAKQVKILGIPTIALTTATGSPSEEVLNRFNIVECDESEVQTKEILKRQAKWEAEGKNTRYDGVLLSALHCLKPITVRIPFSPKIPGHFPTNDVRVRRDFPRFLSLIKASCALYQYQRYHKEIDGITYHYATAEDYENAREAYKAMGTGTLLGITKTQKEVYKACQELYDKKLLESADEGQEKLDNNGSDACFTADEAFSFKPIYESESKFRGALNELAKKGLLHTDYVKNPDTKRKNTIYFVGDYNEFQLPKYDDL